MPGAENLAAGEGGADCGELGYMLRGAGARRKRSAWVVAAAAARTSGREGEEVSASPSPCVFGYFFSLQKVKRYPLRNRTAGQIPRNERSF